MKHCTLQSDIGFKQINLELYSVYDNENDRYKNLIIYLHYHSDKARPYKIEFDTINKSKLRNDIKQRLKICFKEFKKSDLQTAFNKILTENDLFTWVRTDDSESPLELNVRHLNIKYLKDTLLMIERCFNYNFIFRIQVALMKKTS